MRIVSLLPSLTELVCALGRRDDLVGVTHECDFPPGVEGLPHLTRSRIPAAASSIEIDRLVAEQGGALYDLDAALLESLRPDLILTQAQCDVCAVNEATVKQVAATLPGPPPVESVNPTTLGEVFAIFRLIGALLDRAEEAERLVRRFDDLTDEIARRLADRPSPRTLHLEWADPPYLSGHWNDEIVGRAGGIEVMDNAGRPSRRTTWADIARSAPEVVLLAPCGYPLDRVRGELAVLDRIEEWRGLPAVLAGRVALIDGSAYFSRPGPRLLDSLAIAAAAIDPERCGDLADGLAWELVGAPR